ncbi:hypothetical protein ACQEVG_36455 [Streptomyces sp. CA-135486]|uniref:hypothetical protein n=1 Tax=Streptomyces sp. CA-135486 TaxID=3240049 RepID=UPI003D90BADB
MQSRPNAAAPLQLPALRDWLPEDHLAWFVIEAIEQLHLEPSAVRPLRLKRPARRFCGKARSRFPRIISLTR